MGDFLAFRRMITPVVIQVIFWLGVIGSIVAGLITLATGPGAQKLLGLVVVVGGPIVVRIYCEILIVVFRINDSLTDIRNNTTPR